MTAPALDRELIFRAPPPRITWVLGCITALAIGLLVTRPEYVSVVLVVGLVSVGAALCVSSPRAAIGFLAVWTVSLGMLRRILETYSVSTSSLVSESLLLVEPAVVLLLFVVARQRGALQARSSLGTAVYWLTILAIAETLNPLQGGTHTFLSGIKVGLGGIGLLVPPLLMFWVGRGLLNEVVLRRLLMLVAVLSVGSAVYGLVQEFSGFPSWDQAWINRVALTDYLSLNVGGGIRSFGSFASAQEYAVYLSIGVVVWLAAGLRGTRLVLVLPVVALLATGVVLESSRGVVVMTVCAATVMLCAKFRLRGQVALLGGGVALLLLVLVAGHLVGSSGPARRASATGASTAGLVAHQLGGLADPFNNSTSTLGMHLAEVRQGVTAGFTMPIGHGTGSITPVASRFGAAALSTEFDLSNAGVAFGIAGMVLYLCVLLRSLSWTYQLAARRRDPTALAVMGIVVICSMQSLNGDLYSTTMLLWLILGWVDRQRTDAQSEGAGAPALALEHSQPG